MDFRFSLRQIYAGFTPEGPVSSLRKGDGGWRAEVCVGGKRRSKRFPGRSEALDWANRIERQMRDGAEIGPVSGRSVADALERYEREVSPTKKGARWESVRINLILRDRELADVKLAKLSAADLAAWRDRRLRTVSGSSVAREMNLLGHVFTIARKEWRWLAQNPMTDVRRPKSAPPRDRRVLESEIDLIKIATGYRDDTPPKAGFARVWTSKTLTTTSSRRS
jgi:hypothetical protein